MNLVKVSNVTRRTELGKTVRVAKSLIDRAVGLLATPRLASGEGLYLSPCKSIHTLFMRYPIDVLFLDAKGTVLSQNTYAPWRVSGWFAKSQGALEFSAGTIAKTGTQVGDLIEMKDLN